MISSISHFLIVIRNKFCPSVPSKDRPPTSIETNIIREQIFKLKGAVLILQGVNTGIAAMLQHNNRLIKTHSDRPKANFSWTIKVSININRFIRTIMRYMGVLRNRELRLKVNRIRLLYIKATTTNPNYKTVIPISLNRALQAAFPNSPSSPVSFHNLLESIDICRVACESHIHLAKAC